MKILQFPIRNNNGGVTKYVLDNWEYIDKTKYHFDFVTLSSTLDYEDKLIVTGAKVFHITCFAEQDEEEFRRQLKNILSNGYDAIHIHTGAWKSTIVEEVAKECNIPRVIIHAHSSGYVTSEIGERRQGLLQIHEKIKNKMSFNLATDFWACSQKAALWLYGSNIPIENIKILKNGIDTWKYQYSDNVRMKLRKQFGLQECFVLGHVGRFSKEKNHEFILQILSTLLKQRNDVRLVLVGSGKLEQEIKILANEMNLLPYIFFLGNREDVQDIYQMLDVFLLPSLFEGFPIVLVEAQCAGLPCVVSDIISRECNISNSVSYLPLNVERWCECIISCTERVENRINAAVLVRQKGYDKRQTVKELEQLYEG